MDVKKSLTKFFLLCFAAIDLDLVLETRLLTLKLIRIKLVAICNKFIGNKTIDKQINKHVMIKNKVIN